MQSRRAGSAQTARNWASSDRESHRFFTASSINQLPRAVIDPMPLEVEELLLDEALDEELDDALLVLLLERLDVDEDELESEDVDDELLDNVELDGELELDDTSPPSMMPSALVTVLLSVRWFVP